MTPVPPIPHAAPDLPDGTDPSANLGADADLASLLLAASQGDARAFEVFYKHTIQLATAVVRRLTGPNHLEDVLSDAYFQAWQQAGRFDAARGNARTWLLTIARSRALDRLRAEKHRHAGQSGAPEFEANAVEDDTCPGPDTLLESLEAHSRLHTALTGLSGNERWVLGLAYFRDLSHSGIATLTGLPLGTIKSLISRSQQKLRDALEPAARTP